MNKWFALLVFSFAIITGMIKLGIIETKIGMQDSRADIQYAMLLHK